MPRLEYQCQELTLENMAGLTYRKKNKSVQAFLITNTERYFFKYVWKITEKCAPNSREAEEGGPRSGTPQGKERHVFVWRELLKLPNHEIYIIKVFLMG